jgi:predicted SprT family Zn-dependent metalloprotease
MIVFMPAIYEEDGYRFVIYFNDHEPAHVHVFKAGGTAKININPVGVVSFQDMSQKQIKRAEQITNEQQVYFREKWDEFYN